MSPTRLLCVTVVMCGLAGIAPAQVTAPKPTPPPAKTPQPKDDGKLQDKAAKEAVYPPIEKKKLHAGKDVRGKQAPTLRVEKWLNKEPVRKGKTVLIDFWATWCPPCRALIPELVQWQRTYKDDLVVIGISDEEPAKLAEFMLANNIDYAIATDTRKKMFKEIDVEGIPHVLVISSDGIVRWQGFPLAAEAPLTEEMLKQIIDADKAARAKAGPKVVSPAEKKPETTAPQPARPDEKAPETKK